MVHRIEILRKKPGNEKNDSENDHGCYLIPS